MAINFLKEMKTIFAEYNPQRNSIDVYTSAGYMLRIDCWEAEKNLRTTPGSDCALTSLVCYLLVSGTIKFFTRTFFKVTLSTRLAPCITTRLTGDYRDRTYTGKCSPALLETRIKKVQKQFPRLCTFSHLLFAFFCLFYFSDC